MSRHSYKMGLWTETQTHNWNCAKYSNKFKTSQIWVDATFNDVYTINRHPAPIFHGIYPCENFFGKPPDYSFLKVFGCEYLTNISARISRKQAPCSIQRVFLEHASNYKSYHCLDLKTCCDKCHVDISRLSKRGNLSFQRQSLRHIEAWM